MQFNSHETYQLVKRFIEWKYNYEILRRADTHTHTHWLRCMIKIEQSDREKEKQKAKNLLHHRKQIHERAVLRTRFNTISYRN